MQDEDEDLIVEYDSIPETLDVPLPQPWAHLNVLRREKLKQKLLRMSGPRMGAQMLLGDNPSDSPMNLFEADGDRPLTQEQVPPPTAEERSSLAKRIQEFMYRRRAAEGRSM